MNDEENQMSDIDDRIDNEEWNDALEALDADNQKFTVTDDPALQMQLEIRNNFEALQL
jgi:hypothetical protein